MTGLNEPISITILYMVIRDLLFRDVFAVPFNAGIDDIGLLGGKLGAAPADDVLF